MNYKLILTISAVSSIVFASLVFLIAKSVMHEILAMASLIITTGILSTLGIIEAIEGKTK